MREAATDVLERQGYGYLEPSVILPAQLFDCARGASGPRRLLAAMLEDALRVYGRVTVPRHTARDRQAIREAACWLESDDQEFAFSFVNVCTILALDPLAIRQAIRQATGRPGSLLDAVPSAPRAVTPYRRGPLAATNRSLASLR